MAASEDEHSGQSDNGGLQLQRAATVLKCWIILIPSFAVFSILETLGISNLLFYYQLKILYLLWVQLPYCKSWDFFQQGKAMMYFSNFVGLAQIHGSSKMPTRNTIDPISVSDDMEEIKKKKKKN